MTLVNFAIVENEVSVRFARLTHLIFTDAACGRYMSVALPALVPFCLLPIHQGRDFTPTAQLSLPTAMDSLPAGLGCNLATEPVKRSSGGKTWVH